VYRGGGGTGGLGGLLAEPETPYRCAGGLPTYYVRCSNGCYPHSSPGAVCLGGTGLCNDGGTYCGGNHVDGDPNTVYVCKSFQGTMPMPCPRGCAIRGDGQDACK
jgi:hypothetical protein